MKIPHGLKKTASMVVLQNQDAFLLLERKNPPNQGMFVPVGGKLEPFETPSQAAIRETFEETGLTIRHLKFGGVLIESSPTDYNWQSYIYLAEIEKIPPPPCDEGRLSWISFTNILDVPTPPTDWMVYKYLLDSKPFVFSAIYDENMKMISMTEEIEGIWF